MANRSAAAVQFVLIFGYNNFTQDPDNRIAKCNDCSVKQTLSSEVLGSEKVTLVGLQIDAV